MQKRWIRACVSALLLCALLVLSFPQGAMAAADGMVRVLLTRVGSRASIGFTTTCAYKVENDTIPAGTGVTASASGGRITVSAGGKSWSGASVALLRQAGGSAGVRFTAPSVSNTYCGDLLLSADGSSVRTVLRIYIEDYLYGVVGYEMSDSFPLEALKAQAVCARTYAMRLKKTSGAYDLTDSTTHQVFKGLNAGYANVIAAVDATRGQCLMYGGAYAGCWYTASNGGQTETAQNAWGGAVPYSVMKDDPYDFANPSSTKKGVSVPKDTTARAMNAKLESLLKSALQSELTAKGLSSAAGDVAIEQVVSVKPHEPRYAAPSRAYTMLYFTLRVSSVHIATGKRASTTLSADIHVFDQFASAFGLTISSTTAPTVWVEDAGDSFDITLRRYGHGVGLSQRGAQQMAGQNNMTAAQILAFYFEGTSLTTREFADTTAQTGAAVEPAGKYALLAYGDTGEEVKALQRKLQELGYFGGEIGGNYLSITSEAVRAFQKANGMSADGVATSAVQEAIFAATPKATPTPTPAPTAAPTAAPAGGTVKTGQTVYVNAPAGSKLAVYASASTAAKRTGSLERGASVRVWGVSGAWAAVSGSGAKGYVLVQYLQSAALSAETTPAPTPAPTPTPAPAASQGLQAGQTAYVLIPEGSRLTVYKKASTVSGRAGVLERGAPAHVYGVRGEWAAITSGKVKGYARTAYLSAQAPAGTPTPAPTPPPESSAETSWNAWAKVRVPAGKKLPLCNGPALTAAKLGYLANGSKLQVLARAGDWIRVTNGKQTGYVPLKYVQVYE